MLKRLLLVLVNVGLIGFGIVYMASQNEASSDPAEQQKVKLAMAAFYERLEAHQRSWFVSRDKDQMGRERIVAVVHSLHPILDGSDKPPETAELYVRRTAGESTDVFVVIPRELSFACNDECSINIRLDDGPVEQHRVSRPSDHSDSTFFIKNPNSVLSRLRQAKTAKIEAAIYNRGTQVMEFNVGGLNLDKP